MKYQPISCSYYDELELLALRRQPVCIKYQAAEGIREVQAVIKDLFSRKGEEFLVLADDTTIRLDRLVEVDGKAPDLYCYTPPTFS